MARRRRRGRNVNGILLLDKPKGLSSNHALQQFKRLYDAAKAGHTGSLYPLATGLLPICLGYTTKFSAFLLDADKRYRVHVRLGVSTETADAEGAVTATAPTDHVTEAALHKVAAGLVGTIEQLPPMYSAVKHGGQRLYALARAGKEVVRTPRQVQIHSLVVTAFEPPVLVIDVHCSKGTYVRTLAEEIGSRLGCGAHVSDLRRTAAGPYTEDNAAFQAMPVLEAAAEQGHDTLDALLLPLDSTLGHCPAVRLSADAAFYLAQGQPVLVPRAPTEGLVRLYDADEHFVGVGCILDDGRVQPKRLI
jgi:tRNA pseudouridine55 synthase